MLVEDQLLCGEWILAHELGHAMGYSSHCDQAGGSTECIDDDLMTSGGGTTPSEDECELFYRHAVRSH